MYDKKNELLKFFSYLVSMLIVIVSTMNMTLILDENRYYTTQLNIVLMVLVCIEAVLFIAAEILYGKEELKIIGRISINARRMPRIMQIEAKESINEDGSTTEIIDSVQDDLDTQEGK